MNKQNKINKEKSDFYSQLDLVLESNDINEQAILFINKNLETNKINKFFKYDSFVKRIVTKKNSIERQIIFLECLVIYYYEELNSNTKKELLVCLAFKKWENNNYDEALTIIKRFETEFNERNDVAYAMCNNVLGLVNLKLGKSKKALEIFYNSLQILNHNKENNTSDKLMMHINNNIALIYRDQKEYDNAIETIERNILLQEKHGRELGVSNSYMNMGNVYYFKKVLSKAIECNIKAQNIKNRIGDIAQAERANINLAIFNFELGKLDLCNEYIEKALKSNDVITQKLVTGIILRLELNNYKEQRKNSVDKKTLLALANSNLKNIEELKNDSYKLEDYSTIAEALEIAGESKKAINLLNEKFNIYKKQNDLEKTIAYKQFREAHEIQSQQRELEKKESLILQKEKTNLKLLEINKELEQFTYMISHDLKSPLRTISAFSKLITEEQTLKVEKETYGEMMQKEALKMSELINSLLKYSAIGFGNVSFEDVNLNELMEEVLKTIFNELEGVKIEFNELNNIYGNKMLLTQLFQNIITNAIKYNESVKKNIQITTTIKGNCIQVVFKDNGIGIPEDKLDKVFNAFTRCHPSTRYSGSGIGLATCKKIATIHKGKISVTSTVSDGSTFCLELPLVKESIT